MGFSGSSTQVEGKMDDILLVLTLVAKIWAELQVDLSVWASEICLDVSDDVQ